MALILIDGFEDLTSWTAGSLNATGRNGTGYMGIAFAQADASYRLKPADESATLTIGFAYKTPSLGSGDMLYLRGDGGATSHIILRGYSDGSWEVQRGDGTVLGSRTISGITSGTNWDYMELSCTLSDTVGAFTLKMNGIVRASATNVDTKNGGTKTVFDQVRFTRQSGVGAWNYWDDLYLRNDATFMGDVIVETLYPNGDGTVNQWLGSDNDSVNNYLLVDEAGVPAPNDYVSTPTAGQQDLYNLTNLVSTGQRLVRGVYHSTWSLKSDAAARQIKVLNRGSATTASPGYDLSTSFQEYGYCWENNPEGGAWTLAQVNALQAGVEAV